MSISYGEINLLSFLVIVPVYIDDMKSNNSFSTAKK